MKGFFDQDRRPKKKFKRKKKDKRFDNLVHSATKYANKIGMIWTDDQIKRALKGILDEIKDRPDKIEYIYSLPNKYPAGLNWEILYYYKRKRENIKERKWSWF